MKNKTTDSTANLSRFARDKRQRVSSTERVERNPRPRREADNEGNNDFREKRTSNSQPRRSSFNPHFTADNRLRPEYERTNNRREENNFNNEREEFRPRRTEERSGNFRPRRTEERSGDFCPRRTEERSGDFRPRRTEERSGDFRPRRTEERSGDFRKSDNRKGGFSADSRPRRDDGKKRTSAPRRDDKPKSYPKYNPNKQTGEMRLNRFISQSGVCSRREADDFILAGVVTVNGQVVTELGTKILPTDEVRFNDERLQGEKNVYLVLNKPKGYVTSLDDPHADKTVMDLVRGACSERVYPVGRLDKNSLGLLLITNDGDITRQLTHPSYLKKKIYQVTLDKPLTRADMDSLTEGITLEDGDIFADEVAYASEDKRTVGVEIHSGRNRIVRRMFEHLGYTVQKLDRVYYAGLTKKNLKRGAWRFLTKEEVMRLKTGQYE
ncbi:MAG: pseudouridine synthase [Alistipes sp.]|nr:pseudouridine synthase [Alistipes sp.]